MDRREREELDRHITGDYGEQQFEREWESFIETVSRNADEHGLDAKAALGVWMMGLELYQRRKSEEVEDEGKDSGPRDGGGPTPAPAG